MLRRLLAVLCCLLFPVCALAQTADPSLRAVPPVDTAAYPPPDVPACERVDAAYFDDAVFVGGSLMTGVELSGSLDSATFVARVGMSPQGAVNNRHYQVGSQYLTTARMPPPSRPKSCTSCWAPTASTSSPPPTCFQTWTCC